MPAYDRTGPLGQGPMTGRGMGTCGGGAAYGRPQSGYGYGLGRGFGRGLGMGYGRTVNAPYRQATAKEAQADTEAYIKDLENELDQAKKDLKELKNQK